jgi:ElaB/YqjD/DUF883 family membrane-anchored ribosome-binding protein
MDARTEPIHDDIQAIRSSMTDKMEQIEARIRGTVEDTTTSLQNMVDLRYQVGNHPWAALGTSLLIGYALGSLGGSEPQAQSAPQSVAMRKPAADASNGNYNYNGNMTSRSAATANVTDQVMDQLDSELDLLKGAAVAALMGWVRQTFQEALPDLNQRVDELRRERDAAADRSTSDALPYAPTAPATTGEVSTQREVGRSPNYDFVPPSSAQ